jgi:hypothetical protein
MKKINVSNLVLEEVIRIKLFEDKPLDLTDIDPKPNDDDNWDTNTWNPVVAKRVAEKLQSFKGSFFGGPDSEEGYAIRIIKDITSAKQWDDVDKELKKLSGGKGIISFGRSFINDDETAVWNKILKHVKKIYPSKLQTFVQYLGTDTYKQFLPKTLQSAKTIAQQIYDSKSWSGDNEKQLIESIQQIQNAALWTAVDKELQILTGEKGIFSYARSFIRDNDTATWTPILTHIKKKRLVSKEMLTTYVKMLGGTMVYPNIISASDTEKDIDDTFKTIKKDEEQEGGIGALEWTFGIIGVLGLAGKIFGTAGVIWLGQAAFKYFQTNKKFKTALANNKEFVGSVRPGMIGRSLQKFEQFIARGVFGNTGAFRRMVRQLQIDQLITPQEATILLRTLEENRYAIASEMRMRWMKAAIAKFGEPGVKTNELKVEILKGIPRLDSNGRPLRARYNAILNRVIQRNNADYRARMAATPQTPGTSNPTPRPAEAPYQRRRIGY